MQYCLDVIKNKHSVDLSDKPKEKARIRKACSEAKLMLTQSDSAEIEIESLIQLDDFDEP